VKKDLRALLSVLVVATCGCNPTPVPMEMHILSSPDGELLATYYILSGHAFGTDDIRVTVRKQRGKEKTVYEGPDVNNAYDPTMRWNSDRGLVIYSLHAGMRPKVEEIQIDDVFVKVIQASLQP
jgi:hypothetical protein